MITSVELEGLPISTADDNPGSLGFREGRRVVVGSEVRHVVLQSEFRDLE